MAREGPVARVVPEAMVSDQRAAHGETAMARAKAKDAADPTEEAREDPAVLTAPLEVARVADLVQVAAQVVEALAGAQGVPEAGAREVEARPPEEEAAMHVKPAKTLSRSLRRRSHQRGMALMLVMFAVGFLMFLVVGFYEASQFSWQDSERERGLFFARRLAESGTALASHPDMKPGDPALKQALPDGRRIEAVITTEGGRICVTTIDQDVVVDGMRELFILWGVDPGDAAIAAESLADWVDTNQDPRPNGAENTFYSGLGRSGYPANAVFTSLDQMLLVRGMDRVARLQPLWRDFFTLYGDGTIDLNAAPADLIQGFYGVSPESAAAVIGARSGNDGIDHTVDDTPIKDTTAARDLLGFSVVEAEKFSTFLSVGNSVRRIQSTGIVGPYRFTLITLIDAGTDGSKTPLARLEQPGQ